MADQLPRPEGSAYRPPEAAPATGWPGPPPPKKPLAGRLAAAVARHSFLSLAVIVVLVVLTIGLYVYYHGFLVLGPYATPAGKGRSKKADGSRAEGGPAGDEETERLIDTINGAS